MFRMYPAGAFQIPEKSGLPSGNRGAGAARFGFPSGVRGIAVGGTFVHCAKAGEPIRITIASDSGAFISASEVRAIPVRVSGGATRHYYSPTHFVLARNHAGGNRILPRYTHEAIRTVEPPATPSNWRRAGRRDLRRAAAGVWVGHPGEAGNPARAVRRTLAVRKSRPVAARLEDAGDRLQFHAAAGLRRHADALVTALRAAPRRDTDHRSGAGIGW